MDRSSLGKAPARTGMSWEAFKSSYLSQSPASQSHISPSPTEKRPPYRPLFSSRAPHVEEKQDSLDRVHSFGKVLRTPSSEILPVTESHVEEVQVASSESKEEPETPIVEEVSSPSFVGGQSSPKLDEVSALERMRWLEKDKEEEKEGERGKEEKLVDLTESERRQIDALRQRVVRGRSSTLPPSMGSIESKTTPYMQKEEQEDKDKEEIEGESVKTSGKKTKTHGNLSSEKKPPRPSIVEPLVEGTRSSASLSSSGPKKSKKFRGSGGAKVSARGERAGEKGKGKGKEYQDQGEDDDEDVEYEDVDAMGNDVEKMIPETMHEAMSSFMNQVWLPFLKRSWTDRDPLSPSRREMSPSDRRDGFPRADQMQRAMETRQFDPVSFRQLPFLKEDVDHISQDICDGWNTLLTSLFDSRRESQWMQFMQIQNSMQDEARWLSIVTEFANILRMQQERLRGMEKQMAAESSERMKTEQSLVQFKTEGTNLMHRLQESLHQLSEQYRREVRANAALTQRCAHADRLERELRESKQKEAHLMDRMKKLEVYVHQLKDENEKIRMKMENEERLMTECERQLGSYEKMLEDEEVMVRMLKQRVEEQAKELALYDEVDEQLREVFEPEDDEMMAHSSRHPTAATTTKAMTAMTAAASGPRGSGSVRHPHASHQPARGDEQEDEHVSVDDGKRRPSALRGKKGLSEEEMRFYRSSSSIRSLIHSIIRKLHAEEKSRLLTEEQAIRMMEQEEKSIAMLESLVREQRKSAPDDPIEPRESDERVESDGSGFHEQSVSADTEGGGDELEEDHRDGIPQKDDPRRQQPSTFSTSSSSSSPSMATKASMTDDYEESESRRSHKRGGSGEMKSGDIDVPFPDDVMHSLDAHGSPSRNEESSAISPSSGGRELYADAKEIR